MRRREFISLIAGATAWPLRARAEQMPVVGFLHSATAEANADNVAAFRRGLAEAGYVEGKNVTIEYHFTNFRPELMSEAASDVIRRNASVIFAADPGAVVVVRNATTSIPVVALDLESDPVAKGYVKSLARPGGNLTGMFLDLPELSGKHVGLLKEIVPRLSRVAIFGVPGLNEAQFAAAETAVRALGLEAEMMEVRSGADIERAFEAAGTRHVDAGIQLTSPLVFNHRKELCALALAKRLPVIFLLAEFAKSGGLIAYGPSVSEIFRGSADYVAKILHGAKPSELPIRRPEKFNLVINLKTSADLGISVPPVLLATADEVIE